MIGSMVVVGLVMQQGWWFLSLSAVLWWNVIVPKANPFDAAYNALIAKRTGAPLTPAPAPRRFAQGMAAAFMLGIGTCLLQGWSVAAWVLEGFLVVALAALLFGRFCMGSYVFWLVTGKARFANRTLPWASATAEE